MEPTTSPLGSDDEWELCNDDGFVYKRKKRRVDPSAQPPPDPVADPQEDERRRREHKRRTLLKLKTRYQREIDSWEILSNTLRAMEENAQQPRSQQGGSQDGRVGELVAPCSEDADGGAVSGCGSLVDELLSQVSLRFLLLSFSLSKFNCCYLIKASNCFVFILNLRNQKIQ